jgi:hypothetical protein
MSTSINPPSNQNLTFGQQLALAKKMKADAEAEAAAAKSKAE